MVQEFLAVPAFFLSMDRVQEVREVLAMTALLCIVRRSVQASSQLTMGIWI
jgi:hypothetical protein